MNTARLRLNQKKSWNIKKLEKWVKTKRLKPNIPSFHNSNIPKEKEGDF
jgi:hypothetical protein